MLCLIGKERTDIRVHVRAIYCEHILKHTDGNPRIHDEIIKRATQQ